MSETYTPRRGRPPKVRPDAQTPQSAEPQVVAEDRDEQVAIAPDTPEDGGEVATQTALRPENEALHPPDRQLGGFEDGWEGMETAPSNGRPVLLYGLVATGIPISTPAFHYTSRRWEGSATRWVPYSEWRILNSIDRVPFDPVCWTRY